VEKKMYGKTYTGPARAAFVIDIDGTVLGLIEKIDTKNHADELFELIESINTPA
jgi:peroxiredoxin Q/BCP